GKSVVMWLTMLVTGALAASPAAPDSLPLRLRIAGTVAGGESAAVRIAEPSGIAVDAFGTTYVSDAALHHMQRFDARGAWLGESGSLGSDPGQLRRPGGVVLLGTLSVAVLDLENRRVETYDLFGRRSGTLIDLLGTDFPSEVGRVDPVAIAADRGGALYIADGASGRLWIFDPDGRRLGALAGLAGPRALAFAGGSLLVAEARAGRVVRIALERALPPRAAE